MADGPGKSGQRQFLVKVQGVTGFFETKTGGNKTATVTKVWDGGQTNPDVISSLPEVDNVVVSRTYDQDRDGPVLNNLRDKVSEFTTTLSVTPLKRNMEAFGGNSVIYPDSLLVGVTEMEADSNSGDPARYQLEFACPRSKTDAAPNFAGGG